MVLDPHLLHEIGDRGEAYERAELTWRILCAAVVAAEENYRMKEQAFSSVIREFNETTAKWRTETHPGRAFAQPRGA